MHVCRKKCAPAFVADGLVNMACHGMAASAHSQEQATRACMVVQATPAVPNLALVRDVQTEACNVFRQIDGWIAQGSFLEEGVLQVGR